MRAKTHFLFFLDQFCCSYEFTFSFNRIFLQSLKRYTLHSSRLQFVSNPNCTVCQLTVTRHAQTIFAKHSKENSDSNVRSIAMSRPAELTQLV